MSRTVPYGRKLMIQVPCKICKLMLSSEKALKQHEKSETHRSNLILQNRIQDKSLKKNDRHVMLNQFKGVEEEVDLILPDEVENDDDDYDQVNHDGEYSYHEDVYQNKQYGSAEESDSWDTAEEYFADHDQDDQEEPLLPVPPPRHRRVPTPPSPSHNIGSLSSDEDAEFSSQNEPETNANPFYPFPSRNHMLLHIMLFGGQYVLPRSFLKFLWWLFGQFGVQDLPTLSQVTDFAKKMPRPRTVRIVDAGCVFFVNSLSDIIQMQMANPNVASKISRYPEDTIVNIELLCQSQKWRSNPIYMTPMIRLNNRDFFVGDLVLINEEKLGLIHEIYYKNTYLHVKLRIALRHNDPPRLYHMHPKELVLTSFYEELRINRIIPLTIHRNLEDINPNLPHQEQQYHFFLRRTVPENEFIARELIETICEGSELKRKANGKRVVNVPLMLWSDETSGNTTKKWNKYESVFVVLAGLPFKEQQKLKNLHFLCTSNRANVQALLKPIAEEIYQELEKGIECFDAYIQEDVLVVCGLFATLADNPRASELCQHLGPSANKSCRFCHYNHVANEPTQILPLRTQENYERCIAEIQMERSHTRKRRKRTEHGVSDTTCELVNCDGFNYHSLLEPLHMFHLGAVKYECRRINQLSDEKKKKLATILDSLDLSNLASKLSGHHLINYLNSFVGRDLKIYAQIAPFIHYPVYNKDDPDECEERDQFVTRLVSLAKLMKLIFVTKIPNLEEYTTDLGRLAEEYVTLAFQHQPAKVRKRIKYHLMMHLGSEAEKIGVLLYGLTERFERTNAITRQFICHTDRKSTSKDVATRFGLYEITSHLLDGGYISVNGQTNTFYDSVIPIQQAGEQVVRVAEESVIKNLVLGFSFRPKYDRFDFSNSEWTKNRRRKTFTWNDTKVGWQTFKRLAATIEVAYRRYRDCTIEKYQVVVTSVGQRLKIGGSFRAADSRLYRLEELLLLNPDPSSLRSDQSPNPRKVVVVRQYREKNQLQRLTNCRLLRLQSEFQLLRLTDIERTICIFHDCITDGNCRMIFGAVRRAMERTEVGQHSNFWRHSDDVNFVLNEFRLRDQGDDDGEFIYDWEDEDDLLE
ncbi:hypothetical protein BKA69DRAFT_1036375 [Paraphysoderma sedebokerense]|nr:hypothetical protein BKA69DRAFT_1036375 [Paraphysoderma sedebokerense]